MNRSDITKTNWVIYGFALFAGIALTIVAFVETANPGTGSDAGQSRFGFSLNEALMYAAVSVFFILLLLLVWKKIKPYHIAVLTFVSALLINNLVLSVTSGWVGLAGMMILFFGAILSILMSLFVFIATRISKKRMLAEG